MVMSCLSREGLAQMFTTRRSARIEGTASCARLTGFFPVKDFITVPDFLFAGRPFLEKGTVPEQSEVAVDHEASHCGSGHTIQGNGNVFGASIGRFSHSEKLQ